MKDFKVFVYSCDGKLKSKDEINEGALDFAKQKSQDNNTSVVWSVNLQKIYQIYINGIQVSGSY